jgi:hypothetical protein
MPASDSSDNTLKFFIGLTSAVVSLIGAWIVYKLRSKMSYFKKTIEYQVVGISSESDIWGKIRISWNDKPFENLYFFKAQILNDTLKDAPKNMVITFSFEKGCVILNQHGVVTHNEVVQELLLEDNYFQQLRRVENKWNELDEISRNADKNFIREVDFVTSHKKFILPILNRNNIGTFNFLVVTANLDRNTGNPIIPTITIGISEPGFDITWKETKEKKKRRKFINDLIITILYIVLAFPIIHYSPDKTWAVWLMFANSFLAYGLGLGLGYILRVAKIT